MQDQDDRLEQVAPATPLAGQALRQRAKEIAREEAAQSLEDLDTLSPEEVRQTIHELRVHQIELTLQNEELRRSRAELQTSRALYSDLYERAPMGYLTLNEQELILQANLTATALLGVPRGQLVKQLLSRFIVPDDRDGYYLYRRHLLDPAQPRVCELRMVRPDGTRFWARLETALGQDGEGQAPVSRVTLSDITARREAEEALRESEAQFSAMFQLASIGMAQAETATGPWTRVNGKLCEITGYSANELLQLRLSEITERDLDAFQRVVRGEQPDYRIEKRYIRKDGSLAWVNVNMTVIRAAGLPTRTMATIEDITERKRAEENLWVTNSQLAQAVARSDEMAVRAEAANRAKSEFLANMSHELRTPMTAILGCSELLNAGDLSPTEQGEFLETIQRSGQGLLGTINDILDLSRIEADRLPLDRTDCPLQQILDDVLAAAELTAAKKNLNLQVAYSLPVPATIHTDPARLRQILVNLVGNAVKFTKQGEVSLTVRCRESAEGTARVQFVVSDTGIGIPAAMLDEIFQPFVQVDGSHTRPYGGTGLGLAICERLVQSLDGHLEVTSELGRGSTFTLTVDGGPWRNTPDQGASPAQATGAATHGEPGGEPSPVLQGRVLLVEDEPSLQVVIRHLLRRLNLEVEVAGDGELACQMAEQARLEGRPYAVILMDLQLPQMDGLAATRWLRTQGWAGPIIALTAHAMVGDRERCLEAGCDDYLPKPITSSGLRQVLRRYLGQGKS